jgi:uncharacterized pyridoxamine 5'-phosphate oxidase family protein
MPGYGIEPSRKGLLSWKWAVQRLSSTQNYLLATVRADGRPHVMPVWGIWIDDRFYFSTGRTSVKAQNLAKNPNCVLCAGEAKEAVILEGKVTKTRKNASFKRIVAAYFRKYKFDVSTMGEPFFCIHPRVIFGQVEETYPKTATRWRF